MKYLNLIIIAILFGGCSSARNLEKIENNAEKNELYKAYQRLGKLYLNNNCN